MPVAQRRPSACDWPRRAGSKRQTPARVASSSQGSLPGDRSARSSRWQEFDGEPIDTKRAPPGPKARVFVRWPPTGRSRITTSGSPAGSSCPGRQGQRSTRSLGANQRYPPCSAMPLPLASPKRRVTSARPSPVVSRSATTPPPIRPPTATKTSPLSATTRWRAAPMPRATTTAQNPSGSARPPSSGSHWTAGWLDGWVAGGDGGTAGRRVATPATAISIRNRRSGTVRRMVELRGEDCRIVRRSKPAGQRAPAVPPSG